MYDGARYHGHDQWALQQTEDYIKLLRDYHDNVLIEVGAHDHYADLRYHSSDNVFDFDDTPEKFDFHNLIVTPGITPNKE